MNNFLSCCGLVYKRISTSEKDLPVKDGGKAYLVYADLVKDIIFLAIIINAPGGIASVLSSTDWNFANTVSLKEFSSYHFHTFIQMSLICYSNLA